MSDINYQRERCWTIQTKFPVTGQIVLNKLEFAADTLSYDAYQRLLQEIDHDRVFVGNVNVYSQVTYAGKVPVFPKEINGKRVLKGSTGASYSYETGKASIRFADVEECAEHVARLVERGLLQAPLPSPITTETVVLAGMLNGDAITKQMEVSATEGDHIAKAVESCSNENWEDENGFCVQIDDVGEILHLEGRLFADVEDAE